MPQIDLSILNQRQTPAFYADVLANRPAAGFVGRIFISTNTFAFFRDNGTGWDLIGGPGTGTVTGSGANGQVSFWNGASSITGTNDLFWDSVNGHLGIGTNVPGTALDVHHDQPTVAILNQTVATNDVRIGFQNNGVGLWRIGAFYNAGANDFGIFDAVASIQPVTVKKTTGQVLIGTSTVGSGKLVVASATGDNHIQIVGAAAPSLRIDSAESGPTKRIGIGLATAVNNFIQNSQNLDMCIFNGSTSAAGNMLFGIYDTGLANIQEAARISSARNFLIGTITDTGQKLQVSGTALITGGLNWGNTSGSYMRTIGNTQIFASSYTGTNYLYSGGTDFRINNQADNASLLILTNSGAATLTASSLLNEGIAGMVIRQGGASGNNGLVVDVTNTPNAYIADFRQANSSLIRITGVGNLLIGTTTDNGYKLAVNGSTIIQNPATNTLRGGFALFTLQVVAGVTTNFFQIPSGNWGGTTEISWVSAADSNRSGAALLRWAYDVISGTTGVVFTAYSNNQNAIPTFDFSGGFLRINILGGSADYYVQFKIAGSQAS